MTEPLLEMRGIRKRFAGAVALDGVDLEVRAGEVHALVGENGAGKSTLMKVLSGAVLPDAGTMLLAGAPYAPRGPKDALSLGVAMIYQELTLAPDLTVGQNLLLGQEPSRLGVVDRKAAHATVDRILSLLDCAELTFDAKIAALGPGPRQLVEIGRALLGEARIVVLDEPTSSLSFKEARALDAVLGRLRERGVAIVYITHFLEEVERLASRYTVLRDGRTVGAGEVAGTPLLRLVEAMVGRPAGEALPRKSRQLGEPILEVFSLTGARLPKDASLSLRRGEILGLAGLVGAGRTELVRAVFGLDAVRSGSIRIAGAEDRGRSARQRVRQGLGLLSEDRRGEGLALERSIEDNVTLSRDVHRFGVLKARDRTARVSGLLARLGVKARSSAQAVVELSGGNQQKVALARLLQQDADVLLLDEPTRGIDVGSKAEIYERIFELAARGKAILVISSYLPELLAISDRIAVMHRGRLGPARPVADWTQERLLEAATRGEEAGA